LDSLAASKNVPVKAFATLATSARGQYYNKKMFLYASFCSALAVSVGRSVIARKNPTPVRGYKEGPGGKNK
jgi:hypothetical protein